MRIIVTVAVLVAWRLLSYVQLPDVEEPGISPFALGINSLVAGFVLIELLSFVLPGARRLRHGGTAGRSKLNYAAECLGLGYAAVQAAGIVVALQRQGLVKNPGLSLLFTAVLPMVVATGLTFAIARVITRYGLGNGFCCLILFESVWPVLTQIRNAVFLNPLEPLTWVAAIAALVWMFSRRPQKEFSDSRLRGIPVKLPAFPQGIAPVYWSYIPFSFIATMNLVFPEGLGQPLHSAIGVVAMSLLIAALSFATFQLFSNRNRIQHNLPSGVVPAEGESFPIGWMLQSTAVLVIFAAAFQTGESFLNFHFSALGFVTVVMLVAFGLDVASEWRFRQRNSNGVALIELDNVYTACYLEALLSQRGLDSLVRAFQYRSLFFFLAPIVKMELLVPAAEADRARAIIEPDRIKIV